MSKEDCVIYLLHLLWREYGVAFVEGEESIFILKIIVALEMLESEAARKVRGGIVTFSAN